MKTRTAWIAAAMVLGCLTSCAGWDPAETQNVLSAVDTVQGTGAITPSQAEALREAVKSLSDGIDMADIGEWLGAVLVAILGSVLGVRKLRGPAKPMANEDTAILKMLIEAAKKGQA